MCITHKTDHSAIAHRVGSVTEFDSSRTEIHLNQFAICVRRRLIIEWRPFNQPERSSTFFEHFLEIFDFFGLEKKALLRLEALENRLILADKKCRSLSFG